ncbi:plasmid replication initiator RepA [Sodalis-like secondary symbiont of Drepanosiphum platanoidis]|uniref:plasmid replication initiator RepA n=1 Tax=Sodalis-like secondary symbiont of Drepanosiphum platanoidis TaxID=2994493 RepID=UPI0034642CEE
MTNKKFKIHYKNKKIVHPNKCYVKNPNPKFVLPSNYATPPRIIIAMRKAARENKPSIHPIWRTQYRYHGITGKLLLDKKSINLHRKRAIDAIAECIAAHVNIITCKVHATVSKISDTCGLTTYNNQNIPSYSRASRALTEHFEAIGVIQCERIWDSIGGSYIPNIIYITELFFELIGYELGKFKSAQNQQLAWENKKLKNKGENPISLNEARRRVKKIHIQAAMSYRHKNIENKKRKKHAKRIALLTQQEAKYQIQKNLIKMFTKEELGLMGLIKFKKLVDKHYFKIKKLAITPSPPPLKFNKL